MASARYTVLIPKQDELGRPLQLSTAAHQYITNSTLQISGATVHPGNPFDALTVWAEDEPVTDSTIKQMAVHVGELANVRSITVTKEGKTGATWQMTNPHYVPQMGAESSSVALEGIR